MIPTYEKVTDDPVKYVMKYLYNMENFEVIESEINETNVIFIYSLAYAMRMPKLLRDLEGVILSKLLTEKNAPKFYIEGIRFDNRKIIDKCEQLIIENFDLFSSDGIGRIPNFL